MPPVKEPLKEEVLISSMNNLNIGLETSGKELHTFVPNRFDFIDGEESDDDNLKEKPEVDDEEVIMGQQDLKKDDENDHKPESFTAKGPMRGTVNKDPNSNCPYARREGRHPEEFPSGNDFSAIDPVPNVNPFENQLGSGAQFESLTSLLGIPGLPFEETEESSVNPQKLLLDTIDNIFGNEETLNSRIGLKDPASPSGYSFLPTFLSLEIDELKGRIGINLPRTIIPSQCYPKGNDGGEMDILIQMDMNFNRVVKVPARFSAFHDSAGSSSWVLDNQFLQLDPFSDGSSGLKKLLSFVSPSVMSEAISRVNRYSFEELQKPIGPNNDSWLILHCCKEDVPENRALIVAIVKKLLSSQDPAIRRTILRANQDGVTPLICACLTNKSEVVRFLAEVFYDMGEDITKSNSPKHTLLDLLIHKGDAVADVMEVLLQLKYQDGRKVFDSRSRNKKGEMAIHLAAKEAKCPHRIVQLLQHDFDSCMTTTTDEKMLPIHYACQYSRDPALVALLIFYDGSVINARRKDGFTPLHIVAARSEGKISSPSPSANLVPLEEEVQCRMIKLLLENGADKTMDNHGYKPINLVNKNREMTKALLKIPRSRKNSPNLQQQQQKEQQMSPPASVESSGFGSQTELSSASDEIETPPDSASGNAIASFNFPHSSPFGNGSVTSGNDSDSDGGENNEDQLNAIAEILMHHPVMQDVLENILPQ